MVPSFSSHPVLRLPRFLRPWLWSCLSNDLPRCGCLFLTAAPASSRPCVVASPSEDSVARRLPMPDTTGLVAARPSSRRRVLAAARLDLEQPAAVRRAEFDAVEFPKPDGCRSGQAPKARWDAAPTGCHSPPLSSLAQSCAALRASRGRAVISRRPSRRYRHDIAACTSAAESGQKLHRATGPLKAAPGYRAFAHGDIATISRPAPLLPSHGRSRTEPRASPRPGGDIAPSLTTISPRYRGLRIPAAQGKSRTALQASPGQHRDTRSGR